MNDIQCKSSTIIWCFHRKHNDDMDNKQKSEVHSGSVQVYRKRLEFVQQ